MTPLTTSHDKIIDQVQKLLRLSRHNDSVEEASSAAALAQKLMFEHKISSAQVEGTEEPFTVVDVLRQEGGKKVVSWRLLLLDAVAVNNFCRVVHLSATFAAPGAGMIPGEMEILGRGSDVESVLYLYRYLRSEIDRLCKEAAASWQEPAEAALLRELEATLYDAWDWLPFGAPRPRRPRRPSRRRFAASFRLGAVETIRRRLELQRRAQEQGLGPLEDGARGLALVHRAEAAVEAFVRERYPHLKSSQQVRASDLDGYCAGRTAAESIRLETSTSGRLREPPRQLPR